MQEPAVLELGGSKEVSDHAVLCGVRQLFPFLSRTMMLTIYFFLQAMQYGTEDNSTVVIVPFGAWGKYKNGEINFSFSRSFASSGRWAWRPDTAIFSCNNLDTTCYKRTQPSVHRLTQCLVHLFCCQLWKMQLLLWCVIAAYSWSYFSVYLFRSALGFQSQQLRTPFHLHRQVSGLELWHIGFIPTLVT